MACLPKRAAQRILINIRRRSTYRRLGFDAPTVVIGIALESLKTSRLIPPETGSADSDDVRLVVKSITRSSTRIVFDLFNDAYDAARAHRCGPRNDLPVLIVPMRRRESVQAPFAANPLQALTVNFEIRFLHNRYGVGSEAPFSEDSRSSQQGTIYFLADEDWRDYKMHRDQVEDLGEVRKGSREWLGRLPCGKDQTV